MRTYVREDYIGNSPVFEALHVHVRFTNCERIDVRLVVQVCQRVIHETVSRFIGANGIDDIEHVRVALEAPVVFRDFWCRFIRPVKNFNQ